MILCFSNLKKQYYEKNCIEFTEIKGGKIIMALTFRGGLHIDDHKSATNAIAIKKLDGCSEHIYPLQQHIGAPLEPCVKVGDSVKVGQKIADSTAFVSAPVHSSISGTVKVIEPRLHTSGAMVTSIVVENDEKYEVCPNISPKGDYTNYNSKQLVGFIREAGIVGMGGAGFPTHVKLSPPPEKKITHVIVNGAECEPYLTSDHRRMLETPEAVLLGLKVVMRIFDLKEGYVGIELNKPDAIEAMKKAAEKEEGIHIKSLKTKYPQGAEKQLINAVTKKVVPAGGLPADVGCVVINVDTATAIGNIFTTGMPLISRIVTVSGDCVAEPCNYEVRTGTPISYVFESAGGFIKNPKKVIAGGPMMGTALFSLDPPIIKTSSGILALSKVVSNFDEDGVCIKCGKCVSMCPMHLMPLYINKYAKDNDVEMAEKYNALDCIECGVCSYLCPGKQNPLQNIRLIKQIITEKRRSQQKK